MIEAQLVEKFGLVGRLFPLLNKRVNTPRGPGILLQVFGEHDVRVELSKTPGKLTRFLASQISEREAMSA